VRRQAYLRPDPTEEPLMRSHLLVQIDGETRLEQALTSGADCLWLDFEIAEPRIREMVSGFLQSTRQRPQRPRLYVHVKRLAWDEIDSGLEIIMKGAPDGIVLPKSRNGADVQHLGTKLAVHEAQYGLADGGTQIIAIAAQTPAAAFQMGTYIGASRRLAGLAWAPDDLACAVSARATHMQDGALTPPLALARSLVLMAAKAAGVTAIDCAYSDRNEGLKSECEAGRRDGFTGKLAIDPDEIATINAVFAGV
jgi:citrate lyase subunit beta / citryl-CoA lyase